MKNFKKIAAVFSSTVMLGSTLAFAGAAFPAPYVEGGNADVAIVYGSTAANTDLVAVADITQNLQSELAKQTATPGTPTAPSVDGEIVQIRAPGNDLSFDQSLDVVRQRLTKTQLPTILADGRIRDQARNNDYTQRLNIGNHKITYGSLDEEDYVVNTDLAGNEIPVLYLDQSSGKAWELVVSFDDTAFNASTARAGEELVIGGKTFTVDPGQSPTATELVLFSSAQTEVVGVDESRTVQLNGQEYEIRVIGANTDAGTATIEIAGQRFQVEEGDTEWVGDQKFHVNRVFMQTVPTQTASVEIFAGADELKIFRDGPTEVEINDETVDGVLGNIVGTVGGINQLRFEFHPGDMDLETDEKNYLEIGESVVDPVFGTIQMVFHSASMDLKSSAKEVVDFRRSGDHLRIVFDNREGNSYTFEPLTNNDGTLVFHENFYHANTVALGRNNVTVLQEGNQGSEITRLAQMRSNNPHNRDEIVFRDLSTGEETTVESGDEIWTTGAYVQKGNLSVGGSNNITFVEESSSSAQGWFLFNQTVAPTGNSSIDYLYSVANLYTRNNAQISGFGTLVGNSTNITITEDSDDVNSGATLVVNATVDGSDSDDFNVRVNNAFGLTGGQDDDNENAFWLSHFGTYVEEDTDDRDRATFYIPSEEVTYNVYVGDSGITVTPGVGSGGTGTVKELGSVTVSDSEVTQVSSKNLIVVGGSCVNSVAATLLGSSSPLCGADFTEETGVGAGQYLIETYTSPYSANKVATLVAGYNAGDTTSAVRHLISQRPTIAVGESLIGPQ